LGRAVRARGSMRCEGRELLLQVLLAAGGALYTLGTALRFGAPNELLELASAVFAQVFKNRHSYSTSVKAILSTQARTSACGAE
jgi:hypothetical protein